MGALIRSLIAALAPRKPAVTWSDCIADLTEAEREAEKTRNMKAWHEARAAKKARLHAALRGSASPALEHQGELA